jgi:Na+-transporting NADH:ubiquinone oxidoreductase subunit A
VKRGTPVFFNKNRDFIKISSPVSGTITEIVRGAKRKMLEVRIEADGNDDFVSYPQSQPSSLNKEQITSQLVESGLWSLIRQRPYTTIADPKEAPKAIFISGFDSAPLAANLDFVLKGQGEAFQAGLDALAKLTQGKVHLNTSVNTQCEVLTKASGVERATFKGPHPAGNVGIQIHHISPINKGDIVWTVQAQDVVTIGNLFLKGQYVSDITIALAGSEIKQPQYYSLKRGAQVTDLLKNQLEQDNVRVISGNVLTGTKVEKSGYLGYYHNLISVIPEGNYYSFFGWLIPSPKKHSFYRTAFSWLTPNKEYRLDTNVNGGERAFVMTGALEKVFPMDIYPIHLLKAIMVQDIDQMEQLGIYELDEEDIALCEYISTSKIDMQELLRGGLDLMRKEMS